MKNPNIILKFKIINKYVIIFMILFFTLSDLGQTFSENDENINNTYIEIDKKIKIISEKIISKNTSNIRKKLIFEGIIRKVKKYIIKFSTEGFSPLNNNKIDLINHIIEEFKKDLQEFKKENNLINKLFYNSEYGEVTDYSVYNYEFSIGIKKYFILRKFIQNSTEKYLIVEDKSYNTFIINSDNISVKTIFGEDYNNSDYKKNLDKVYKNKVSGISQSKKYLQNAGLKSGKSDLNNVYLTADFCPSGKHGFEKDILDKFIKSGNKNIAIAITSAWIKEHGDDFKVLLDYQKSGKLNISWVNHTKTHKYNFSNDFSTTFILTPGLILEDEILDVEKQLISNGQNPSIFMRFPGLISDEKIFKEVVYRYGLIPLGSDTWLAKGEKIKQNSIILIHGNKNEPAGIKIFNENLNNKSNNNYFYGNINDSLK